MYSLYYIAFNLAEAALWASLGFWFAFGAFRCQGRLRTISLAAAAAAMAFGTSDLLEISPVASLVAVWTLKFVAGLSLFGLMMAYDYAQRGPVALAPSRFIAAGAIFLMAVYACTH